MSDTLPVAENGLRPVVDFVVIGAMKSGTTTLHGWLSEHPSVAMASWKEPSFFSRDDRWQRGLEWYESLFDNSPSDAVRGEASTSYTDPRYADIAAERLHGIAPGAYLIYLVRDPIERARSHYRHQVQRGRERRSITDALADPEQNYLRQSWYWSCLEPYTKWFEANQILVVRLEDLTGDSEGYWHSILDHIGVEPTARPAFTRNVTATKQRYTWLMRRLWQSGRLSSAQHFPKWARRLGAALLLRRNHRYASLLEGSAMAIPVELTEPLWDDIRRLERWLSFDGSLWDAQGRS